MILLALLLSAAPPHHDTTRHIDRETYRDRYDAFHIHTFGDPTIRNRLTYVGGHGIHHEDEAAPDDNSDRSADEADDYDGDDN